MAGFRVVVFALASFSLRSTAEPMHAARSVAGAHAPSGPPRARLARNSVPARAWVSTGPRAAAGAQHHQNHPRARAQACHAHARGECEFLCSATLSVRRGSKQSPRRPTHATQLPSVPWAAVARTGRGRASTTTAATVAGEDAGPQKPPDEELEVSYHPDRAAAIAAASLESPGAPMKPLRLPRVIYEVGAWAP